MKTQYDFGLAGGTIFLIDGNFMLGDGYWWHGAPALSAGNVGLAVVMPVDPLYPIMGALSKKNKNGLLTSCSYLNLRKLPLNSCVP